MAFDQVTATSLTPSRPAPPIPIRQPSISSSSTAFSTSSSVTLAPSLVATSSYAPSYSGIGSTPNIGGFPRRSSDGATLPGIIRQGSVGFKEDAFASWIWREKWLVLREQSLSVHKNEVSFRFGLLEPFRVSRRYQRHTFLSMHYGSWGPRRALCFRSDSEQSVGDD
jgi:hypothetical protein